MNDYSVSLVPFLLTLSLIGTTPAQTIQLPPPDKDGWIKLFRGDNTSEWYARLGTNPNADVAFPNGTFKAKGDTIETTGSPTGHLAFKQVFSHYRFKMELMIPAQTNCGLLLHVREDEPKSFGIFPRSVEFQGDPSQGMGELWVISDIHVDVKAKVEGGRHTYDPTANVVSHPSSTSDRVCHQSENKFKGHGNWNQLEAVVRGADSVSHIVNGTRVMHYTRLRIENNPSKPLNNGRIAVQSEGKTAYYRNIYIQLLPGDPLYTTTYAEFNARNAIRKLHERKVLILKDGVLGVRGAHNTPASEQLFNIQGRSLRIRLAQP
jgi:hypothetical protein